MTDLNFRKARKLLVRDAAGTASSWHIAARVILVLAFVALTNFGFWQRVGLLLDTSRWSTLLPFLAIWAVALLAMLAAADLDDATLELATAIARNEPFVVQTTKRAVNASWERAGFREALADNTEFDVLIETANLPQRETFRRITLERGLKAAIAWRDGERA